MKTLYLDCGMGAAGDMLTAALLELYGETGGDTEEFIARMNGLNLPGVHMEAERVSRCGIQGTHMRVLVDGVDESEMYHAHEHEHEHDHDHDHHHAHHHTSLGDIRTLIAGLDLPEKVRTDACGVYELLAEAESHAHGMPVEQIHFHEVGTLDAVADIVGCCYLMNALAPERVEASPVCTGFGHVHCAHGILPVPAPATAYLLRDIPTYAGNIEMELCTPTGAALVRYFVKKYENQPLMKISAIGYGCGTKELERANCLRASLGECEEMRETVTELSCNLDDITGEALAYAMERLREAGALEVFASPVQMKKNRPGQLLVCLCKDEDADALAALILRETTTFGVRRKAYERYTLERSFQTVETKYGPIRVKTGTGYGVTKQKAEYVDLEKAAREYDVPLQTVADEVERCLRASEKS